MPFAGLETGKIASSTLDSEYAEEIEGAIEFLIDFFGAQNSIVRLTEYELTQIFRDRGLVPSTLTSESSSLDLFYKHFFIRHCLHRLREILAVQCKATLELSSIEIVYRPVIEERFKELVCARSEQALSTYYLDLNNLISATEESVNCLLDQFWSMYEKHLDASSIELQEAISLLGLELPIENKTLSAEYRRLVQVHHPDKGGDSEQFIEIRRAYMLVKSFLVQSEL